MGRRAARGVRRRGAPPVPLRHARSGATRGPSRSCATRPTRRSRTSSTATATRCGTGAWSGPCTSRGSAARWSGARPTAPSTRPRSTTRWRRSSPTSGSGPRCRIDGEWLPSVLRDAVERLAEVRRHQPDAGGLVIAIDQDHARGIATLLRRRIGAPAVVVTSDDPDASDRIAAFAAGRDAWLVAVRMVSEGVDIPRLRVGVYATTVTTDLFFRQAVGRFVRWVPGIRDQRAWLFLPDDPRLRIRAAEIAEQRRHSLRRARRPDEDGLPEQGDPGDADRPASSCACSRRCRRSRSGRPAPTDPWHEPLPGRVAGRRRSLHRARAGPAAADRRIRARRLAGLTRRQAKDRLRVANAEAAKDIARVSGLDLRGRQPGAEPAGRYPARDRGDGVAAPGPAGRGAPMAVAPRPIAPPAASAGPRVRLTRPRVRESAPRWPVRASA